MTMTAEPTRTRRADAGTVRATDRDIEALGWVVEMYGMPLDLLKRRWSMTDSAARNMVHRWRRAGWVDTLSFGANGFWCWATKAGIEQFGERPYAANTLAAARLRHIRAVIVARMQLEEEYAPTEPTWRSERELRWELGQLRGSDAQRFHVPDGEIVGTRGELRLRGAVEVELTAKATHRTTQIMRQVVTEGLDGNGYRTVIYLCPPEVLPLVLRARAELQENTQKVITVRPFEEG